jgi:hypothetical protein
VNIGNLWFPGDPYSNIPAASQVSLSGLYALTYVETRISDLSFLRLQLAYVRQRTRIENIPFYFLDLESYPYVPIGSVQYDAEHVELSTKFFSKFGPSVIKFCPTIGPVIGVNLSSKSVYDFSRKNGQPVHLALDISNQTMDLAIALEIGFGLEVPTSDRISLQLNGNYSVGLTDWVVRGVYGLPNYSAFRGMRIFSTISVAF